MATKKKSLRLLYIVRNHFIDEYRNKQTSILGVYTSLKKAYVAGHKKATEMDQIGYKHHNMELKVVKYNTYNYVGCSAYVIDFRSEYTNAVLRQMATCIQEWFRTNERYVNAYEAPLRSVQN